MKLCVVAFCLILLAAALWLGLSTSESTEEGGKPGGEKPGGGRPPGGGGGGAKGCVAQPLPSAEVSLCRNLEVVYPELGSISCKIVPVCNQFRQKITMLPAPRVKFPAAVDGSLYVLVMVDPDAPSRSNPVMKYWRHWVVSNITGATMKNGNIRGNVITEYNPPTPPPTTGLHRYQFFVYRQGNRAISIPAYENQERGAWSLERFVQQHSLQNHEASTQYMTEFDG